MQFSNLFFLKLISRWIIFLSTDTEIFQCCTGAIVAKIILGKHFNTIFVNFYQRSREVNGQHRFTYYRIWPQRIILIVCNWNFKTVMLTLFRFLAILCELRSEYFIHETTLHMCELDRHGHGTQVKSSVVCNHIITIFYGIETAQFRSIDFLCNWYNWKDGIGVIVIDVLAHLSTHSHHMTRAAATNILYNVYYV